MNISVPITSSRGAWLLISLLCFVSAIVFGLIALSALNGGWANHILTPVVQFFSLFQLLWNDNPATALWFLVRKSVFTFAYQDPRSGLNLWTYEFNSLTILVYLATCAVVGHLILRIRQQTQQLAQGLLSLCGTILILSSMSYMTSIEHCSGATWIGFVAMYGLGFDEFELYPAWQWLCAGVGTLLLLWVYFNKSSKYIQQ